MSKVLERLETSLRAAVARGRTRIETSAFDVFIAPTDAYFLNLAVPKGNPQDWAEAIREMKAAFAAHGRRPRLEFFEELHPALPEALERQGFKLEMRAPVMTLQASDLAPGPSVTRGVYIRLSPEDEAAYEPFLRRQHRAYGGLDDDGALVWLSGLQAGLRDGGVMAAGLKQGGEFVSGATLQLGGEAAELAGVWTYPELQKRGLALELCQQLLADFFEAGRDLAWLSAAEGAERLYEKLGFERAGTQLNYGLPPGA